MTTVPQRNVVSLGIPAYELHLQHPSYLPDLLTTVVLTVFGENADWEVIRDAENLVDDDFDLFLVGRSKAMNPDLLRGAVYAALATLKSGGL